jgi:hypothetical protein
LKIYQAERQQTQQQGELALEAQKQCGMPALVNFQERKMMKKVIEQRDKANLVCYAYLFSNQTGKLIYIGKCMGYGLPYSTQYTNPQRVDYNSSKTVTLPQPDPNGLYMPSDAHGTWLLMIKPNGDTTPVYVEPDVIVSPFKLQ